MHALYRTLIVFYRRILGLYPHSFRQDYADEMLLVFQMQLDDTPSLDLWRTLQIMWRELRPLPVLLINAHLRRRYIPMEFDGEIRAAESNPQQLEEIYQLARQRDQIGTFRNAPAKARFGRADLVGPDGTARGLAGALVATGGMPGANVLLALAANAPDTLAHALGEAGARCTRLDVYRTLPLEAGIGKKRALSTLGADKIVLASPSAVTGLVRQVELDRDAAVYTIGPTTTAAARAAGLNVTAEAREPSLAGILEAMQCPT